MSGRETLYISKEAPESEIVRDLKWYSNVTGTKTLNRIANELQKSWTERNGYVFNPFELEERENLGIEERKEKQSETSSGEENSLKHPECLRQQGESCLACKLESCVFRL